MRLKSTIALLAAAVLSTSCGGALAGGTINFSKPTVSPDPVYEFGIVACAVPVALTTPCPRPISGAKIEVQHLDGWVYSFANGDGYALMNATIPYSAVRVSADGFQTLTASIEPPKIDKTNQTYSLTPLFPAPPTRAEILAAHESFQGAVLHTSQFGDLNWWPTAWVSLNAADRAASYPQIASWGDTDITVSATWEYGEPGQPYGSGQLVPPLNYFPDESGAGVPAFRASVKDVIQHTAANGKPFVPRIFMSGDNGFTYYMWAMPLIIRALQPQPGDPLDLTPYVKLQMCYDSCVPGYAGAHDDKSLINDAILGTRAACPACVIALEFATGYSSTGDGDAWWQSDAAKALDEADWEGNAWPTNNWEQYWEILDRWLGPAYIRPAAQVSDPAAPFPITDARYYLRFGTPRGPYGVQCLEPYTYQWVRGQVAFDQVAAAFQALRALGCPVIDAPASWPVKP